MKKNILALFIFINTFSYSQIVDQMQIKNEVKEFLAIHMLLLKNDTDELKEFLNKYNYITQSDDDNIYFGKLNISDDKLYSVTLMVPLETEDHIQSQLIAVYLKDSEMNIDYNSGADIYNNIISAINMGACEQGFECQSLLFNMLNKIQEDFSKDNDISFVRENKYMIKATLKSGKKQIYRASNFMGIGGMIVFSGPVDHAISFKPSFKELEDGSVIVSINIDSGHSETNNKTKKFNYKEFMAYENLNDRIWMDSEK